MKKKMKVILTASMLSAAAATAAFAEGPGGPGGNMGQALQMEGQQVPGGDQQPPQMNEQQAPQENNTAQPPQMNEQQAPQENNTAQPPQMNEQQTPQGENNAQPPQMNEQRGRISFDEYVANGTISQETCDAIKKYMEEHKPQLPEGAKNGEKPALPEGAGKGNRQGFSGNMKN